ncbi:MAG: acetolactate decarboxylase [Actinomycetes bacterium]
MSDHRGHRHHVVDEHLATAARLHLTRLDHDGFVAEVDGPGEHAVHQASSIDALLKGAYDGDLTLGELLEQGDLGLGTVQALDGELVVLDGVCYQVTADGVVRRPAPTMRTPFAVVCRFDPHVDEPLDGRHTLGSITERVDEIAREHAGELGPAPILAVRIDGRFAEVDLRSVPRQDPPYPPLGDVVEHQRAWEAIADDPAGIPGTLVGFRFPPEAQGVEVAGYHLHFLSDDRTIGGHVTGADLIAGRLRLDGTTELHLEVPAGVVVADADTSEATAAIIRQVEGG